jgi:hypothetical protein
MGSTANRAVHQMITNSTMPVNQFTADQTRIR